MSDSKIVIALEKFKADYAWDKSLINPDIALIAPQAPDVSKYEATYLEEFIRSQQAISQQDGL